MASLMRLVRPLTRPPMNEMMRSIGSVKMRVAQPQALHLLRRLLGNGGLGAALDRGALLDGVGELVRQQLLAVGGLGAEPAAAEKNLIADGEGLGVELPVEPCGALVGVDPHV